MSTKKEEERWGESNGKALQKGMKRITNAKPKCTEEYFSRQKVTTKLTIDRREKRKLKLKG